MARRRRDGVAELFERPILELTNPLGAQTETISDLAQRLRGSAEAVMGMHDLALALVKHCREARQLLDLHALDRLFVLVLRQRIGQEILDGPERSVLTADRFFERTRRPLGGDQALDLIGCEAGCRRELRDRRLLPVRLAVIFTRSLNARELAQRAIGEQAPRLSAIAEAHAHAVLHDSHTLNTALGSAPWRW